MSNDNSKPDATPGYFKRVASNDSTRKGLAAGLAGVIVGAILEALA